MTADLQLRAIGSIVRAVDADLWLRGGWAMDFFLGEVTRPHRDIDFFCRDTDAEHIAGRLADLGYQALPGNDALQRDLLGPDDLEMQVTLVSRDANGCPIVPAGPYAGSRWPADLLTGPAGRIGDVSCRIVGPRAQIEIKEMMPVWVPGLPRREKDRADVTRLRAALARNGGWNAPPESLSRNRGRGEPSAPGWSAGPGTMGAWDAVPLRF